MYAKIRAIGLPIVLGLVVAAALFLLIQIVAFGKAAQLGYTLAGGSAITLSKQSLGNLTPEQLKARLAIDAEIRQITQAGQLHAISIESSAEKQQLVSALEGAGLSINPNLDSVQTLAPALAKGFFASLLKALLLTFLAMAAFVFILYRKLLASALIILALASDLLVTLAAINLLGIKLEIGGLAALLMLIGYSIDSNILLTNRVLRTREESLEGRIGGAAKTGLMMSATSLAAVVIGYLLIQATLVKQILAIVGIGLVTDFAMTWIQNAALLELALKHETKKAPA